MTPGRETDGAGRPDDPDPGQHPASTTVTHSGGGTPGPLAGLRVLELANLYAGPLIAAMLGDLGADVVKVEPPGGEPFRAIADRNPDAGPGVFTLVSRNKRTVAIDHDDPEGRALLARLTAAADVIVANHPQRVLDRMGCTYEAVRARNPSAVMVNVTGWGDGPYGDRGGNGTIAEAFSGLTDLLAAGTEPTLSPALLGDSLTALSGTIGALAACHARATSGGEGQYVEVPMFEAVLTVMAPQIASFGTSAPTSSSGLRRIMATGDDQRVVATAYTTAQIVRLLDAVGVEPAVDGRPITDADQLAELVGRWVARHDLRTVLEAFEHARIPATAVNDVGSLIDDPHVRARGVIDHVDTEPHGRVSMPRPAPRFGGTPAPGPRFAERPVGADTAAVLADWLGHDADPTPDPANADGPDA